MLQKTAKETVRNATFISIIISLIGFVAITLSIVADEHGKETILPEILRDFGILMTSIGIISVTYELLLRKQLLSDYNNLLREIVEPDAKRLGVINLFRTRSERHRRGTLPEVLIRGAKSEVFCLGLGLVNFIPEERELIRQKIADGCKFRFLIFDISAPSAPVLDASLGYGNRSLTNYLVPAVTAFREFQEFLRHEGIGPDKFEARLYDIVPPWGLISVDLNQPGGRIFVEINGHRVEGSACPGFSVAHTEGGLYDFFSSQLQSIWENAGSII